MNGLWCYFKSKWTPEYCQSIIKKSEKYNWETAVVGNSVVDVSIRKSRVKFIQKDNPDFKDVFNDLWLMALEANQAFFNIHVTRLNFIQIGEYDASERGEYKKHHDVFWINNDPNHHRKLSCSVQLSNPADYLGGEMKFHLDGFEEPLASDIRQQGSVIFFPSFIPHEVTPVTYGTRHSLVAWFEGPKWR
jgi:PKHD-type hydroxylase